MALPTGMAFRNLRQAFVEDGIVVLEITCTCGSVVAIDIPPRELEQRVRVVSGPQHRPEDVHAH